MTSSSPCNWPTRPNALTMERFGALDLRIETKPDLTPVTDADRGAEEALRATLSAHRPDDALLGEEFGGTAVFAGPPMGTRPDRRHPRTSFAACRSGRRSSRCSLDGRTPGRSGQCAGVGPAVVGRSRGRGLSRRSEGRRGESRCRCRRAPRGEPVVFRSDHGLGQRAFEVPRPQRRGCGGVRGIRRLLVVLTRGRGRRRHRRRARGQAVGPRALDILVREAGGRFTSVEGSPGPHGGSAVATNGLLHDRVLASLV